MSEVIGYDRIGRPIYPAVPEQITTRSFILCSGCTTVIRDTGGPSTGSLCPRCATKGMFTTETQARVLTRTGVFKS